MKKHYYKGQLIVTSKTRTYKYALIYFSVTTGRYIKMGVGDNLEKLKQKERYLTKGYGHKFEEGGFWSSQYHNPALMHIVELEIK